jgi:hypothetical protein
MDPHRKKERADRVDPILAKSSTEQLPPTRDCVLEQDNTEPTRTKVRNDRLLPALTKSKMERLEASRDTARRDKVDPHVNCASIESSVPDTRECAETDNVEDSFALERSE